MFRVRKLNMVIVNYFNSWKLQRSSTKFLSCELSQLNTFKFHKIIVLPSNVVNLIHSENSLIRSS